MRKTNKHLQKSKITHRKTKEEQLKEILQQDKTFLFLILDCIQDPQNLGACLRTANASGVDAVIIPKNKSAPLTRTAYTVSCGAINYTPLIQVVNLAQTIKLLKSFNITVIGTSDKAEKSIYTINLRSSIAIVVGSEERGMRQLTIKSCDKMASLPMYGQVECLNVSVSTGICLYEVLRQRRENLA